MRIILAAQPTSTVPNTPPLAINQAVSTDEDAPVNVTLTGSDADNNPITFEIVASPAHGVLGGIGSTRLYTPSANYYGSDSFTFRVSDGKDRSA